MKKTIFFAVALAMYLNVFASPEPEPAQAPVQAPVPQQPAVGYYQTTCGKIIIGRPASDFGNDMVSWVNYMMGINLGACGVESLPNYSGSPFPTGPSTETPEG